MSWNSSNNTTLPYDMSCEWLDDPDAGVMTSIYMFFIFSLLFVFVGLIGNGLSMAVFSSREMQTVSSNVYLLALAASDGLYLLAIFISKPLTMIRCWLLPEYHFDVMNHYSMMCLLLQYLSDLFSDYSTCLILAFTVERGIAVFWPIRYKDLCTVGRARLVCGSLFCFIAISIAPYHFIMMHLYEEYHVCAVAQDYKELFSVLYVIEFILFRVGPVFVIAVLNAFIIARVTKLTRAKNKRRAATFKQLVETNNQAAVVSRNTRSSRSRAKNEDRNLQLTFILILVSTSYIILYIPVLIDFCLRMLQPDVIHPSRESLLRLVGNYSKTLYICGFAINFFLYTVSGRVFRDQLKNILCLKKKKEDGDTSMMVKTLATSAPEASSAV